jgi:FKBP-type peptidyl-prolyl cis-trans isomerase
MASRPAAAVQLVHYTGKLDDGSVFDSSVEGDPLQFTLGSGRRLFPSGSTAFPFIREGFSLLPAALTIPPPGYQMMNQPRDVRPLQNSFHLKRRTKFTEFV